MADNSKIEWCDATWSPVTGCTPISAGCANCYAERMSKRLAGRFGYPEAPHSFDVTWHPGRLRQPTHWKKPRRIFLCSMSDPFHIDVKPHWLGDIFAVIKECPQHIFQILTKRPGKMLTWFEWYGDVPENVWLGATAENQEQWDRRVSILRQIPAVAHFVSIEPMLSRIDMHMISSSGYKMLSRWYGPDGFDETGSQSEKQRTISQVIVGGETGPGARPMHPKWVRGIRDQCQAAGVPFFFKGWGEWRLAETWSAFDEHGKGAAGFDGVGEVAVKWKNHTYLDGDLFFRIGRKLAGNELDGKIWQEFPEAKDGHQD